MTENNDTHGHSVIGVEIINALKKLWEGHFSPENLPLIEIGLRALMVSKTLSQSYINNEAILGPQRGLPDGELFDDGVLDYEFKPSTWIPPQVSLPPEEHGYLEEFVEKRISEMFIPLIPKSVKHWGEVDDLYRKWYQGCDDGFSNDEDGWARYEHGEVNKLGNILRDTPEHAAYLVKLARAGVDVYSVHPVAKVTSEFIFSEWPRKIFDKLDQEYTTAMREIRGPGIAVELPPLTALVLSKASHRSEIPQIIVNIRDEYNESRNELWSLLGQMWNRPTVKEQIEVLRVLTAAADGLFQAAFPERVDALSLGLDLARISPAGIAKGLQTLREHDLPKKRVAAVSFSKKLSIDLRKNLANHREVLKRHLTLSEYHDFGLS